MSENIKKVIVILIPVILTVLAERVINAAFDTFNWLWWLLGGSLTTLLILFYILPGYLIAFDNKRRMGIILFLLSTLAVGSLLVWEQVLGPQVSSSLIDKDKTTVLIRSNRWITYDPLQFNPYTGSSPDEASIQQELIWIKEAGFTGVITFTSRENFTFIPEIAKQQGLAVIMGVWDPTDIREIKRAISAKDYVDAYSVGHNGFETRYSYQQLLSAIQLIRFKTSHPVTTTEKIAFYLTDRRLIEIGDWIFPDVHVSVQQTESIGNSIYIADATRDGLETISMSKKIAEMKERNGKPILLKMVAYPMSGITNASLDEQVNFFVAILDGRRNVIPDMPADVSISIHSAFDTPWKTTWPFHEWDPYTGLLESTGTSRPAVQEIIKRLP